VGSWTLKETIGYGYDPGKAIIGTSPLLVATQGSANLLGMWEGSFRTHNAGDSMVEACICVRSI
jgi:hypothetical protein